MEMFGIMFGSCFGLIAVPAYCSFVAKVVRPYRPVRILAFWASVLVLSGCLLALSWDALNGILLWNASNGIIETHERFPPWYFAIHSLLALAASPALGCVCLLGRRQIWWQATAALCWVFAVVAVLYNINVAESLYGIQ
jgi:hypothetical protein